MSPKSKPNSQSFNASRFARRLSVETLDARVVLSGSGIWGTLYPGPELVDRRGWEFSAPATIAAEVGEMRAVSLQREAYSGLRTMDRPSPEFLPLESRQAFGGNVGFLESEQFKGGASGTPATLSWDGTSSSTIWRKSFDVYPALTNVNFAGSSVLIVDHGTEGNYAELRPLWFDNGGSIVLVSKWSMTERAAARYYGEKSSESMYIRDEPLTYASKSPSGLANMSGIGGGKELGALFDSSAYIANIPNNHNLGGPAISQLAPASANGRTPFILSAANPASAIVTQAWSGQTDSSAAINGLAQSAVGTYGPASEGGAIDIGANLLPGSLSWPKQSVQRDVETVAPDQDPAASDELDQFWADLGENLESLEPAQLVVDADDALAAFAGQDADWSAIPVDHALAIHDVEGGTVELTVNRNTEGMTVAAGERGTEESSRQVSALQLGTRQFSQQAVEIEMDATVAMFQAFEVETAPHSKPQAAADDRNSDTDASDAAKQQPQVQPTDRASLSPLSLLIAAATTTVRPRQSKDERNKLSLIHRRQAR